MIEEVDGFEFLAQLHFLLVGDVLERCAVGAEVEADKLHDTLAADDVAAEVADDVDDVLSVVLQGTCLLEVTLLPSLDDASEATAIIVGRATNSALCAAHGQTRQDGLVLAVEHVELAILVATATVVLVEALEGVLDAGKVGDATIDGLEEVVHREEGAVEGRDMVEVEGQVGSATGYLLAVLDELFDTTDLGEGRSHGADAEGTDCLSMLGKVLGTTDTGAAHMYDDLEVLEILGGSHPSLGNLLALVLGEHIALATGTVDEDSLQAVALEQSSIFRDDGQIDVAVGIHRSERGVDKTFDLFHYKMWC